MGFFVLSTSSLPALCVILHGWVLLPSEYSSPSTLMAFFRLAGKACVLSWPFHTHGHYTLSSASITPLPTSPSV